MLSLDSETAECPLVILFEARNFPFLPLLYSYTLKAPLTHAFVRILIEKFSPAHTYSGTVIIGETMPGVLVLNRFSSIAYSSYPRILLSLLTCVPDQI